MDNKFCVIPKRKYEVQKMPGIRQQEKDTPIEFIEDFLAEQMEETSEALEATKVKRSTGEYFRKIEQLLERKQLHDDLSDYEWDD